MNIVSYYRVSTKRQGESRLGLEGQMAAVETFAKTRDGRIIASYTEIESGRKNDRPEILKALGHARRSQAVLVVAKLDRLARNVAFLSALMESGVEFTACDNPHANRLTIHILAAVAEDEARRISDRTKAALAARRARGGLLGAALDGCRTLNHQDRIKGAIASGVRSRADADEAYGDIIPSVKGWRAQGMTLAAIAQRLSIEGQTTRRGRNWNAMQVSRILRR